MPILPIDLNSFPGLIEQYREALEKVEEDTLNRPLIKGWREVAIILMIRPDVNPSHDGASNVNTPSLKSAVKTKMPGFESRKFMAFCREVDGKLRVVTQTDDPTLENIDQTTIFEHDEKK